MKARQFKVILSKEADRQSLAFTSWYIFIDVTSLIHVVLIGIKDIYSCVTFKLVLENCTFYMSSFSYSYYMDLQPILTIVFFTSPQACKGNNYGHN